MQKYPRNCKLYFAIYKNREHFHPSYIEKDRTVDDKKQAQ